MRTAYAVQSARVTEDPTVGGIYRRDRCLQVLWPLASALRQWDISSRGGSSSAASSTSRSRSPSRSAIRRHGIIATRSTWALRGAPSSSPISSYARSRLRASAPCRTPPSRRARSAGSKSCTPWRGFRAGTRASCRCFSSKSRTRSPSSPSRVLLPSKSTMCCPLATHSPRAR